MPNDSTAPTRDVRCRLVRLGVSDDGATPSFEFLRDLTPAEERVFTQAAEVLHEFRRTRKVFSFIQNNDEALSAASDALLALSGEGQSRGGARTDAIERLEVAIVNFLTMARLYLDHRRTQLKRRHGQDGPVFKSFEDARKAEHSNSGEYRFVDRFRNYVQHCGMPLQVARVVESIVETHDGERAEYSPFFGCKRDQLLTDFDWASAKSFLVSLAPEFELLPMLHAFAQSLQRIEHATLRLEGIYVWEHARAQLRVVHEACDESHHGAVVYMDAAAWKELSRDDGGKVDIHLRELDAGILERFDLIERSQHSQGWRIKHHRLHSAEPPRILD